MASDPRNTPAHDETDPEPVQQPPGRANLPEDPDDVPDPSDGPPARKPVDEPRSFDLAGGRREGRPSRRSARAVRLSRAHRRTEKPDGDRTCPSK
ncbi:hypothetical protein [Bordetella bronchialis]|uniref:Uncharacterized protein n=1 Tax=Bordetella bronchialis TaxID=463025 RepID=A0ABN4R061_9BORD|nr:hypothetical protein [Bordetella bronchialis]ANN65103.1 hypothetical protein BAU06_01155 [Bordetella bronchialis]